MLFKNRPQKSESENDFESIVQNCEGYLDSSNPKLYPKTIYDKIYNFKKDFSNHDYANVNYDNVKSNIDKSNLNNEKSNINIDKTNYDNGNIDINRRTKNDILREKFFLSDNIDKNDINDQFNRFNGKKIECHSIVNDITKSGPDVKVSGSLNMKLLNPDRYNRVLTTTETFMETAEASFTKYNISKLRHDGFENFVKKSERYYTSETGDKRTEVLNNSSENKGKTEIRIFYNPTFKTTGDKIRGFCQYCKRKCPRTEEKCCPKCECLEIELATIWKDNWLNILCLLSILFMLLALLVQCFIPSDVCEGGNSTDSGEKCFDMM